MQITIESLKDELGSLALKVAAFEKQSAKTLLGIPAIPATEILLAPGERYVGLIVRADGIGRHIILMAETSDAKTWQEQMDWAASVGGALPDRVEGALLFATMPDEFEKQAYWTREQHAAYSDNAWAQHFSRGTQDVYGKSGQLRARFVRSVTI